MTRTTKWTVHEKAANPKYFTHNSHYKMDPKKVCKAGSGKYNWGKAGDEMMDEEEYMRAGRRNSNHEVNESEIRRKMAYCERLLRN